MHEVFSVEKQCIELKQLYTIDVPMKDKRDPLQYQLTKFEKGPAKELPITLEYKLVGFNTRPNFIIRANKFKFCM